MKTNNGKDGYIQILSRREQFRDKYWRNRDPIVKDRLLWRAQTFRHLVHLLPNQSILELGCAGGLFTEQLHKVTRGENLITSVTFAEEIPVLKKETLAIEFLSLSSLPGELEGRTFDFVIAMDLLDKSNNAWFLKRVFTLLKPGGQIIFYESNPWNVMLQFNRFFRKLFGQVDQRQLGNRSQLYELISQLGFIKISAVYNDFVYAPLTYRGIWLLKNLSILFENLPFVRTLAGSILIHAQKPPQYLPSPEISLSYHEQLKGKISVVVPCHNEEMNVIPLVTQLLKFYDDYLYEIVLVDDNSRDNTKEVITELAKKHPKITPVFRTPPNGVGRAIRDGYKAATGEYILSMDCDFQHLLPEIRDLFDTIVKGYDVVIGSRFSRHSVLLNYPFQKIVANRAFHSLARILFFRKFRDLTNNLKLMKREVVDSLELKEAGFAINAETGLQPILMGFKVAEVPISWINRTPEMGISSFKLLKVGGGYWDVLFRLWVKFVVKKRSVTPKLISGKC
ncbi:MAG: bifunctional class I SAM-dependent methyltransferase/glycosyltransferase family 2 protein [Ginsengibacter sp.]